MAAGTLYLVGVGPGDPELLTLKAARILGAAPVVAYPETGEDCTLALDIARAHLNPAALLLPVAIPMAVERGPAQAAYDAGAEAIRSAYAAVAATHAAPPAQGVSTSRSPVMA